ncbi:hypothetical protein D1007_16125 [Hordeum vulgare]|nr:hypothetical protein D1007_16125 [Hordeum vulgare]
MRPDRGRVLIARTPGMAALERAFLGHALYDIIIGQPRSKVTPEALTASLEFHCGILLSAMKVEVTGPPFHFFVRWSRGKPSKLPYKMTLSLEGLLEEAWDSDTVNLVLAGVDSELIDMLPATDKWLLPCMTWLRDPSVVSKVLTVSIPAPPVQP